MELKDTINLIKEYISLCRKLYVEDYITGFTCTDDDFSKLSPDIISCIKRLLGSMANSWITFTGETFILDIVDETTIDLLDSSEWHLNDREYLNNFAFDILILRNEWKKNKEHKYINKKRKKEKKRKESLYEEVTDWLKENYTKETQEKLMDLVTFWAIRGRLIYTSEDVELTEFSFEEILENHSEYLE